MNLLRTCVCNKYILSEWFPARCITRKDLSLITKVPGKNLIWVTRHSYVFNVLFSAIFLFMSSSIVACSIVFLFLLHNWQIMPFGHITPVHMVVCRLMV